MAASTGPSTSAAATDQNGQHSTTRSEVEPRSIPLPPPGTEGWQPILFPSIDRPTDYQVVTDPAGRRAYRAVSDCGASAMSIALPEDFDLTETPRLGWRWRIESGLEVDVDEERTKSGDDFAARVYVLFAFEPERASMLERMERSLGRRLFGVDLPGKTINYVWASQASVGESWTSPHHGDAQLVAAATESGADESQQWRPVVVDLQRDARRLFSPPPARPPYALAVMVDADDTCESAVAWFSDFRLLGPAPKTRPEGK